MSNELKNFLFPRSKRIDVLLFLYRHQDNEDVEMRPYIIDRKLDLANSYIQKLAPQFKDLGLIESEKLESGGRVYSLTDKGVELGEEFDCLVRVIEEVEE